MVTKNKRMKFGWKRYFEPTPKRIRVFGDSLVASATFGASIAAMNGHPIVATVVMVVGVVGKFISNFFTDEPVKTIEEPKKDGE
jgi:hypothetical protein